MQSEKMDVNHKEALGSAEIGDPNGTSTGFKHGRVDRRASTKNADRAFELIGDNRVTLTDEDNKRIRRKTDRVILAILVWVYFLQILDKSVLGYGATFGLQKDTVSLSHLLENYTTSTKRY